MHLDTNRAIGVFDSGLGGLTVLDEIMKLLPNENIVYFGDTARVPYGPRSSETITKYTFQSINFLLENNIKAIVIACNTASARSLTKAQERYNIPIIGMIEPGAKAACELTKNNHVGVIGTVGTINSKAYESEIKCINNNIEVYSKACPLFVPIAEEGWADSKIGYLTAVEYLSEFKNHKIDSLVLGCTHYPIFIKTISKVLEGEGITLVNPAKEAAKELKNLLKVKKLENQSGDKPEYKYYVSDMPEKFVEIGKNFLNIELNNISLVEISKY
ncbi:MAG: glutamate racemase [Filifactoraceae bacterium]